MKKIVFIAGAILMVSVAATAGYKAYDRTRMTDFMKANIEALTNIESGSTCPHPYDVPNHYHGYYQRVGQFEVLSSGSVITGGKSFPISLATPGTIVKVSYEIGHCDNIAEGACCDHTKIGDIINATRVFF